MPAVRGEASSKRRSSATPTLISTKTTGSPQIKRNVRPVRWRRRKTASSAIRASTQYEHTLQHLQTFPKSRSNVPMHTDRPSAWQSSDSQICSTTSPSPLCHLSNSHPCDKLLNQSFSDLNVESRVQEHSTSNDALPRADVMQHTEELFTPRLAKPKRKKREGYGFSYSETFWCDSDEYPDTEGDTEHDTDCEKDSDALSVQREGRHPATAWHPTTHHLSFRDSGTNTETTSFNDVVVLRDVGSFHIAKPERTLPCTKATRGDTIRLKALAQLLVNQYQESNDVQAQLLSRLERMVHTEQEQQQRRKADAQPLSITECVLKLQDFLLSTKKGRIQTGEHHRLVEHEIEWVKWILEASMTGVIHLRTTNCTCRPDWEGN